VKYIRNDSTDPYYNLAFEEHALHTLRDDDYIMLWQNDRAVVIGKHQIAAEEVNLRRAEELGVRVVRRNTGGGAVYHDLGNLNFSYITDWDPEKGAGYDVFLDPVIHALERFGVTAEKRGRNDLVVDGKKISGNAQCIHAGRLLHHGTLLVSSDLSVMPEVLSIQDDKFASKGIKSVRSRVANISRFTKGSPDIALLKQALVESFFESGIIDEHIPAASETEDIRRRVTEKYGTWEWNIGSAADYSYKNSGRYPGGKVEVRLDVKKGVIERCKIYGDFLALIGVDELERAVVGCRAERNELAGALGGFELTRYFGITLDELLECFE